MKKNKVFLIDGSGYIFRAYHALPPLTSPGGTPVGAVYGFTGMLFNLINEYPDNPFLVVFDAGRQTFRQKIYEEYKSHRPPAPEDLVPQFPLFREVCEKLGIASVEMADYEADDLIASYAKVGKETGHEVVIISSDKDLMQLVDDNVNLFDPIKKKPIYEKEVFEKFGVTPSQVVDVQALAGDSSDNVPGVPGIGIKTAAELIQTFVTLENLLEQAHTIKQNKRRENLIQFAEQARISKKLVHLVDDLVLPLSFDDLHLKGFSSDAANFFSQLGFKNLMNRMKLKHLESNEIPQSEHSVEPVEKIIQTTANYQMIDSVNQLQSFINNASEAGTVAFDTETNSLCIQDAVWVGFSMAYRPYDAEIEAIYVPLHHQTSEKQIPLQIAIDLIKPFLEDDGVLKIGQNLKFDMGILANHGIHLQAYEDTMLMSYCLDGTLHSHNMDALAKLHLGRHTLSYQEVVGSGKNQKTFDQVDLKTATQYACEDAEITLLLYETIRQKLLKTPMTHLYYDIERPIVSVIEGMESKGVCVHKESLFQFGEEITQRLMILETDIFKRCGHEFNIGSPKQLGVVLFEEQNLPQPKKTKTGTYSTDSDVLEELSFQGHEIATLLLEWRKLSKLKSTYVEGLLSQISDKTGRVHTSYALTGTNTGRFSSSNPNLQNIPIKTEDGRRIRQAFQAPEGYKIVTFDYSQIELRLLTHFADVPVLKKAFHEGVDIHKKTASDLFKVDYDQITSDQRRYAKTVNFGIIYGISGFGLAQQLSIPVGSANQMIQSYMDQYPGIGAFMTQQKEYAAEHGYTETLLGRRCYTPGIHDRNRSIRNFAERQAVNAVLQGSNADIIKKAMYQIHNYLQDTFKNIQDHPYMLLQVHDELVFEIPQHILETTSIVEDIKKIMETCVYMDIPLVVDAGIGDNWNDAK